MHKEMRRVYHTWDKWECYPAGFYSPRPPKGMTIDQAKAAYAEFLADLDRFSEASERVITEWVYSSEHYLTNERMNRIAWIGQASMCIETGIGKFFCGGFFQLSDEQKNEANLVALKAMNRWMARNGYKPLTMAEAQSKTQADLY